MNLSYLDRSCRSLMVAALVSLTGHLIGLHGIQ